MEAFKNSVKKPTPIHYPIHLSSNRQDNTSQTGDMLILGMIRNPWHKAEAQENPLPKGLSKQKEQILTKLFFYLSMQGLAGKNKTN